jgi:hypothetical protein
MYKIKCTGLNKNYGEKDEIRLVADHFLSTGIKRNWFEVISYEGSALPDSKWAMKKQLMNIERDIKILELKKKLLKERLKRKVF